MSRTISIFQAFLWRNKFLHIGVLFTIATFLWVSAPPPASAENLNLLGNWDFESGSLAPYWKKWGYPASTAMVLNCCAHTPGDAWSGYIVPNGKWVELQQELTVGGDGYPLHPGGIYTLQAWVYTSGMTATVAWWLDDGGGSRTCGTTSSTTWVVITCHDVEIPLGTPVGTKFNVHLGGNAPSGQWAITDEWFLTEQPLLRDYAIAKKTGTFYGVQGTIDARAPVLREPGFSYVSVNVRDDLLHWVEAGITRDSGTCDVKFVYATGPDGIGISIDDAVPAFGHAYTFKIFRAGVGVWQLEIRDEGGALVTAPIGITYGMDYGTEIQAAGEVLSLTQVNDLGDARVRELQWFDSDLLPHYWDSWTQDDGQPYYVEGIAPDTDYNVRVYGNVGNPIPDGSPCR